MSQLSEFPDMRFECVCCGKQVRHGGWYRGSDDLIICSDCVSRDDLRPFGIVFGDAILDAYRRGFPVDKEKYTTCFVRSILQRLEAQIYRTIADGLYNRHIRSRKAG
jgi:hypothetical protein